MSPPPGQPPPPIAGTAVAPGVPAEIVIPANSMVVARGVSKWFGDLVAVSDVTFGIGPGVTALLVPNGAGKSTLLRMLCGMAAPSSGDIEILGKDPRTDPSVAADIGLAWKCVPNDELLAAAEELAAKAAKAPRELLMVTKDTIHNTLAITDSDAAIDNELDTQVWSMGEPAFVDMVSSLKSRISKQ